MRPNTEESAVQISVSPFSCVISYSWVFCTTSVSCFYSWILVFSLLVWILQLCAANYPMSAKSCCTPLSPLLGVFIGTFIWYLYFIKFGSKSLTTVFSRGKFKIIYFLFNYFKIRRNCLHPVFAQSSAEWFAVCHIDLWKMFEISWMNGGMHSIFSLEITVVIFQLYFFKVIWVKLSMLTKMS